MGFKSNVCFPKQPNLVNKRAALVLNADYRPLSYLPLSVWPWQDAVKAKFLDRVDVIAEYDETVHSPSVTIKIPQVCPVWAITSPNFEILNDIFSIFCFARFSFL